MARRSRPRARQVVKRIPMDSRNATDEQFRSSAQAKFLNFFRAETGDANFRNPYWQISDSLDVADSIRPLVDLTMIPIQRKAMQVDDIEMIQHAEVLHQRDEFWIS